MRATVFMLGLVVAFGLVALADDGSVAWPGAGSGGIEAFQPSSDLELIEPGFEEEPNGLNWRCFIQCWKTCYAGKLIVCSRFIVSPSAYKACLLFGAAYFTALCLRVCWV